MTKRRNVIVHIGTSADGYIARPDGDLEWLTSRPAPAGFYGMNAKDTAAVFAIYAADAKVMPPDSPTLDGPAAHPVLAGLIAGGATDFVLTPTTVYGIGDLAYAVGTASFKMGGASETVKYAEVLRRGDDGKWRYVVDMFSNVAPPAAAAAPAKKK